MAIAAKNSKEHSPLYSRLETPIKRLAAEFSKPSTRSIIFVQGLLLLCTWPFPFDHINEDPSWMYCGVAVHMAMLLGLHRPQHPFTILNALDAELGDLRTRTKTWLMCFITDQM